MNEINDEDYCLAEQFKQSQNILEAMNDDEVRNLCTKEELAHISTQALRFDTINLVAHDLAMTRSKTARDLYEELKYYVDQGAI